MNWKLINPVVVGNTLEVTDDNHLNAAKNIWENITKNTNHSIPNYYFTIKNSNNEMRHFRVKEKMVGGNASFNISEFTPSKSINVINKCIDKLNKVVNKSLRTQQGGKHSSSSSSDSSDSDLSISSCPRDNAIARRYWWYFNPSYFVAANKPQYVYTPIFAYVKPQFVKTVDTILPRQIIIV